MHHPAFFLVLLALFLSVTAFLPGLGNEDLAARAELAQRAIPVEDHSLLEAVRKGESEIVALLLRSKVDPDVRDEEGRTPLMLALHSGRPDLAHRMMEAGADLEARDKRGDPVLSYAVRSGETSVVKGVIELGLDPNSIDGAGGSAIVEAVKAGHLASAKLLLDAGASEWSTDEEKTPLIFHATERGAVWMVERLLESGVKVELARASNGDALVHALVRAKNERLFQLLLDRGLKMNALNLSGESALHVALLEGRSELLPKLLKNGVSSSFKHPTGWTPLQLALQRGDLTAMKTLLAHGANPRDEGPSKRTALDLALALESSPSELEALLEAGADPNQIGPDGRSAIDSLLAAKDYGRAGVLMRHGGNAGAALYNSVVEADLETFTFLLDQGLKPDSTAKDPILVAAVREGHPQMVERLLQSEVKVDTTKKGREGQSALHLAVAMDRLDLTKLLLESGADPNIPFARPATTAFLAKVRAVGYLKNHLKYDTRVTPLMAAADCGNLEMARLLIERGAKRFTWTKRKSYYPIGFASRRDDVKMMQLLLGVDPDNEERWVKVDLSDQMAFVYDRENKELFSTKISSGKKGYRTKTGEFVITNKNRHHVSNVYKGAKMPYFQRLSCGDFGFHEGYCPGHAASHGCLRVPRGHASKLWAITKPGDRVVIVP